MSQSVSNKSVSDDGMEFIEIQQRALVEYFSGQSSEVDVRQYIDGEIIKFITLYRNNKYQVSDEKVKLWLFKIAPSCVNLKENNEGEHRYQCHYCSKFFKKTQLLVRHYREQHYDELPEKIFGEQYPFECTVCVVKFKRVEHFNYHMQSKEHLNKSEEESSSDEELVEIKEHSTRTATKRKLEEDSQEESKKSKRESLVTFSQAIEILNNTTDTSLDYMSSSEELSESMTSTPIKKEEVSVKEVDTEDEDDQLLIRALIEFESRFNVEKLSQTLSQSSL